MVRALVSDDLCRAGLRRAGLRRAVAVGAAVALGACHVTTTTEVTRPGALDRRVLAEAPRPRAPTFALTPAGALRFVEPLECATEETVRTVTTLEDRVGPNLATFVIGVIATAAGGVTLAAGAARADAGNALTYAGITGLGVGLPLTIGPWLGHTVALRPGPATAPVRRAGPSVPCGERPLAARAATLTVAGRQVVGPVDADGVFGVSPFALVDAYAAATLPAWQVTAEVDTAAGPRTLTGMIDGRALAAAAPAFLAAAPFDARVEPLRLVPGLRAGTLRASLTTTTAGPALRLVLPLFNDGPGEAWGVRAQVSTTTPALDGRMLYVGHLRANTAATPELLIPLPAALAEELRGGTLELALELRDAHGTAPTTPIRFRGAILGDAPR